MLYQDNREVWTRVQHIRCYKSQSYGHKAKFFRNERKYPLCAAPGHQHTKYSKAKTQHDTPALTAEDTTYSVPTRASHKPNKLNAHLYPIQQIPDQEIVRSALRPTTFSNRDLCSPSIKPSSTQRDKSQSANDSPRTTRAHWPPALLLLFQLPAVAKPYTLPVADPNHPCNNGAGYRRYTIILEQPETPKLAKTLLHTLRKASLPPKNRHELKGILQLRAYENPDCHVIHLHRLEIT